MDLTLVFVKLWEPGIHKLQHALVNKMKGILYIILILFVFINYPLWVDGSL